MENSKCKVNVFYDGEEKQLVCSKESTLMEVLNGNNIYIDAPCGGKCLCGKCKVKIQGQEISAASADELRFLTHKEQESGYRLACATKVLGDIQVFLPEGSSAQIMSAGSAFDLELSPSIRKKALKLKEPDIHDQRDDFQRILDGIGLEKAHIPLELLRSLPDFLRSSEYNITVAYDDRTIRSIEAGDTSDEFYGIAVDIGTTTVVAYLIDLDTGKQIDVVSQLNSQKSFGGDVVSRIGHSMQNEESLRQLQDKVISQLNVMVQLLISKNNICADHIYNVVLVGNTTMMHFLTGVTPKNIAASPFIPASTSKMNYTAQKLGININNFCMATLISSISGYVGADIVSAVLASGMAEKEELNLLIDIGTNGEIVLGNKEQLVCCSTAAGPAFEGAHIKHGVGGVRGALNTVTLDDGNIQYTTIMGQKPIGICGSGIVDALAILIQTGIVDETGRIVDEDEVESKTAGDLIKNIVEIDGAAAFKLINGENTGSGEDIAITQKDIREIQLAKAAIAAGINTLIKSMDKKVEDIQNIFLAGGFGSYIDKKSAVRIGLLPKQLENKIIVLGNAAGTGAIMALLSEQCLSDCDSIKNAARYVELSSTPEFQDEYVDCMYF
ncbi:MAG: ASKHA domain-containing protein [Clostridia bacterium]